MRNDCIIIPAHIHKANWLIAFLNSVALKNSISGKLIDFDIIIAA